VRSPIRWPAIAAALAIGFAWGQEETKKPSREELARLQAEAEAKLKLVRREVKQIDLDAAVARVPGIVAREREYLALAQRIREAATGGEGDVRALLEQARTMKVAALDELNAILKVHRGKFVGLSEEDVRERFEKHEMHDLRYDEEWLVNILDDIEERAGVNIELDARVYKFDVVTYAFEKTTPRAMLRTIGDNLGIKWVIRGDTIYVYKEFHEILFDQEWLNQQRALWKKKREERIRAATEAEENARKEEGR